MTVFSGKLQMAKKIALSSMSMFQAMEVRRGQTFFQSWSSSMEGLSSWDQGQRTFMALTVFWTTML
jgi:hypothetical protein